MKVVLVTKIKNLGDIGEIVDVKSGFARNFLLPYHKALPATEKYIKDFEDKKEDYLKKAQDELSLAEANALNLEKTELSSFYDYNIFGPATEILPEFVEKLRPLIS